MKNKLLALVLALTLGLTFVGCFGKSGVSSAASDSPSTSSQVSAPSESSVTSSDASGPESDFSYIEGKGSLIIGYTVYEPMNFTDNEGNFTGFDTELAEAVCAKLNLKPEFVEINWDTKEIELSAKSIDCIWNGLTITDERKQNMSITIPYVENAQVVVMKADAEYTDTSSLVGKTVCAEAGSAGEETVAADENLKQSEYIAKDVQTSCLMEVAAGTADAAVLDLTLAKAMTGEGTDYAGLAIKDRLEVEDYGVAFRKDSDLCEKVNAIFAELVADGTMGALAEKYGLDLA